MINEKLVSKYMEFNKTILSVLHLDKEVIDFYDGTNEQRLSYKDFFLYIAKYFDLNPSFVEKSVIFLESFETINDTLDINSELSKTNGKTVNISFSYIKLNDNDFILSVKEQQVLDVDQLDQMTKANPKSYIDNRAKNNMLTKTPFTLILVDIDNFKHINDEYGQSVGDMILIEMVAQAKSILGGNGAISRVGGDRFLIMYDITDDYDTVHNFLFKLKLGMQDISVCKSKGIRITVTLGSARYPLDGTYDLLLLKCKKALIRGKNKGRDCFIMYLKEKCGEVTLNDKIDDKINKIDTSSTKNDVYSLISNVTQLLDSDKTEDDNINKALNIIGNYFYVDRLSIARLDIKTHKIIKHHCWYNPKCSIKHEVYCCDEVVPKWGQELGTKNYIRINDSRELDDSNPLKELFSIDSTTASLSFELVVNGKSFGLIRFDMTTGARQWQSNDFQIFLLLSQLFASHFQKNYLKDMNYKTFYFDPKYDCYNFTKMFTDTGDAIINGNVTDYMIVELDIRHIIRYRTIIGKKRMHDLTHLIVKSLEERKYIYGKQHEGPFVVFIEGHDKSKVEELVDDIQNKLNTFTESINLLNLELQAGVYRANSNRDSLVDAIANANLTRTLNKTEEIMYYSDEVRNKALFKTEMLLRIDEALDNNEFLLYLQPKISTKDGTLMGAEALTRWNYKFEKILFPDQFISLFEEQGVIDKLDYRVFENVCIYQKNLIEEGYKPVPISVNVSRYIVDLDDYLDNLEKIRKQYDVSPNLIEIEITEGMFYENSLLISDFINKLHKKGYKVSMDDFGSGYSNLVAMAKLNFDVIKFDKSFCFDLENVNVKVMLDKLIDLVKMLKMKTVCEGVETKENVEYLTKIGCDLIQGYYYSKPIPCIDFKSKYFTKG